MYKWYPVLPNLASLFSSAPLFSNEHTSLDFTQVSIEHSKQGRTHLYWHHLLCFIQDILNIETVCKDFGINGTLILELWLHFREHTSIERKKLPEGQAVRSIMTGFSPDMTLRIEAKQFDLGCLRPNNLVSHSLKVLQVYFCCQLQAAFKFLSLRRSVCRATLP